MIIRFIYGQFDEKIFPSVNWRECCRDAASDGAVSDWAADSMDHDDPRLIEQIRTRLLPRRGVWASPEQILGHCRLPAIPVYVGAIAVG